MFHKIKLVNINVSDILEGRPSIILGLIWTIILHCHVSYVNSCCTHCTCWAVKEIRETKEPIPTHDDEKMMKYELEYEQINMMLFKTDRKQ